MTSRRQLRFLRQRQWARLLEKGEEEEVVAVAVALEVEALLAVTLSVALA